MTTGYGEKKAKGVPNIEVGCGVAKGADSYAAGREAASQAVRGIASHSLSAVIVFASASYHLDAMLSGVSSVVGNAPIIGASSAGEICNRTSFGSVAVMALASPFLRVSLGLGKRVSTDWLKSVHEAVDYGGLNRYFTPQDSTYYNEMAREGRSAFAMLFSPASTPDFDSYSPEILEELKRLSLGRIPFFGGAAVDALETSGYKNFVFYGNQASPDSLVLAIFETSLKFGIAMGHGFYPSKQKAVVTKVRDCHVLEMDGKPAADVFAALHDLPRETLEGKPLFEQPVKSFGMRNQLGQYTLFVPRSVTPEGGVLLAHPVPEGTPLTLMETDPDEMVAAGKDTLLRTMMQSGIARPAAILICSCFLRMHLLKDRINEEITAITDIMPGVPVAGFYSAGEQGITDDHVSRHNNEAIVILLLDNELSYAAQVAQENRILHRVLEDRLAEQQRLEVELAEQVRFLQTLIDNIPNPVFYKDPEGKYLGCNKAFEEYFEVRRDQVLGKPVQDIRTADQIEVHHKVDSDLIQNGGRVVYESTIRPNDGRLIHVITNKALFHKSDGLLGGIVASVIDITDRKHAEKTILASEEKFLKAFHSNPTMMTISTVREGRIIEVNESFLKNMGFTRQEAVGKTAVELEAYVYPEQRDLLVRTMEEKGHVQNLEVQLYTRNGNIRHCLFSAELIELQKVEHVLVLLQDITDRKRAEDERLQRMRLQSVLDMAGTICHEFNQPMQILSGYTEILMSGAYADPKTCEKLRMIREQTARMGIITRKLMAIKDYSVQDYAGIGNIVNINGDEQE